MAFSYLIYKIVYGAIFLWWLVFCSQVVVQLLPKQQLKCLCYMIKAIIIDGEVSQTTRRYLIVEIYKYK